MRPAFSFVRVELRCSAVQGMFVFRSFLVCPLSSSFLALDLGRVSMNIGIIHLHARFGMRTETAEQ